MEQNLGHPDAGEQRDSPCCVGQTVSFLRYKRRTEDFFFFFPARPAGQADREELLPAQVGPGGLQVVREGLRLPLAQTDLQRQHPQPPHGGAVLWLQSSSVRRPEYPFAALLCQTLDRA